MILNQRNGGMLLLESLIAVVIFAVGITAILQSLMNNVRIGAITGQYAEAVFLLNESLGAEQFQSVVLDHPGFDYQVKIQKLQQEPWEELKQLDLSVSWPKGANQRRIALRTILPDDHVTQTIKSIFYN